MLRAWTSASVRRGYNYALIPRIFNLIFLRLIFGLRHLGRARRQPSALSNAASVAWAAAGKLIAGPPHARCAARRMPTPAAAAPHAPRMRPLPFMHNVARLGAAWRTSAAHAAGTILTPLLPGDMTNNKKYRNAGRSCARKR